MDWIDISTDLKQILTAEQAWHYSIIPKSNGSSLSFYIDKKKYSSQLQDELELLFGLNVKLHKKHSELINNSLSRHYHRNVNHSSGITKGLSLNSANGDFLTQIIEDAYKINASDIHIEAYKDSARVRFRIDGKLLEKFTIDQQSYPSLINKIKIKAKLDIAEKRLPQDGRIFYDLGEHSFDIRVSSLPSLHGEKLVLRLLNKSAAHIDIQDLGFEDKQLNDYLTGLKKTHGIVLISGPTGSGKTTTLYATLRILNKVETNILTVEDPIEYTLDGINQVQLKESIGLSFASALRTFLRQDPDIIMLGEIRDKETAQMAIRAALTGHLVLSTVHTNSAWGTVSRLLDMDIPAFLIADTLNLSVAQRLIRILCPDCKTQHTDKSQYNSYINVKNELSLYQAKGCENCHFTGYKGRKALYEVIPIEEILTDKIKGQAYDISNELSKMNISTMKDNAVRMFTNGETSYSEILPIILNEN